MDILNLKCIIVFYFIDIGEALIKKKNTQHRDRISSRDSFTGPYMGPFRVHPGRMSIGALVVIDVHAKERGTVADESLPPT